MIVLLLCSLLIYILIAWVLQPKTIDRTSEKFICGAPQSRIAFSLIAANLSVAGGILALLSALGTFGIWAAVAPLSFFAGLYLFYLIHKRMRGNEPFTILQLNKVFAPAHVGNSVFVVYLATSLLFILLLVLGWELYVGSQVIASLLYERPTNSDQIIIAFLISITVIAYCHRGGFAAVVNTDLVQFGVCFLVLYEIISINWYQLSTLRMVRVPIGHIDLGLFLISVIILNLVYQIQNPITWHIARSVQMNGRKLGPVLVWAGLGLCFFWVIILYVGLAYQGNSPYPELLMARNPIDKALLLVGICAFLLSTVDSVAFSAVHLLNVAFVLYKKESLKNSNVNFEVPILIDSRIIVPLAFTVSLASSFGLMVWKPKIFQSLMAITGCIAVYAPIFFGIAAGIFPPIGRNRLREGASHALFLGFFASALSQFLTFYLDLQNWVFGVIALSFLYGFVVLVLGRTRRTANE